MSIYWIGFHWALDIRNGFGFDVEAVSSQATWVIDDEGLSACAFNGIVIHLPFLVFKVGNPVEIDI